MKIPEDYECEGQMNIYDFLDREDSCYNCVFYRNNTCKYKTKNNVSDKKPMAAKSEGWKSNIDLPKNPLWMNAQLILYDAINDKYHFNVPGQVKDWAYKHSDRGPAKGSVVAWRFKQ